MRWKPDFCLPERSDGHASGRDPQPVDQKETWQIDMPQRCQTILIPETSETVTQSPCQHQMRSSKKARATCATRHLLHTSRPIVVTGVSVLQGGWKCVFRPRTAEGPAAEHCPDIAGRDSGEAMGKACPRDRHAHGRRQRGWRRAQHRVRSALPKGQQATNWKRLTDPSTTDRAM